LRLLYRLAPDLFAVPLASERLFDALFLARLQIKGMFLDLFDDVFLLDLPLETAQRIFNGLAVLNSNLGHSVHPPSGCNRFSIITYFGGYGDVPIVL
jgi:hypothetical protein